MNRSNFYQKYTVDGVAELDFLHNPLTNFEMNYAPNYYRVSGEDDMCPDLISVKVYGSELYWWVIMLVNGIDNPFTEITTGSVLTVPNMLDILAFQKKNRLRRSN